MVAYNQEIQNAILNVENNVEQSDILTMSSGVQLKTKQVPLLRIQAVVEQFKFPDVPEVYNKEKDRMERNPFSEEYKRQVEEIEQKRGLAVIDMMIASGIEIVNIPDNVVQPQDDSWIDELEIGHIQINRDSETLRRFSWLKYVAIQNQDDLAKISTKLTTQLGVSEVNVAKELQKNFPDN